MSNKQIQVTVTADVSKFNNEMDKATKKVDGVGTSSKKSGGVITSAFGKLGPLMAATFSVSTFVNFGKSVWNAGLEFEKSMDKVQATSGATEQELADLTELARELGSTTIFSAKEAADGLGYMALAGWNAEQMMDGLPAILNLAAAGQVELAQASDIVTDVLTMYSMEAEEAGRMSDVMAKAQATSNTTVEQLGSALKYVGGTAHTFGMDIEETSAALGTMANAGIKSSMAGRSLKNILSRLAAPTEEAQKGLDALGVTTTNADGSMRDFDDIMIDVKKSMEGMTEAQKVQIAKQIAGTTAMSGFLGIVESADTTLVKLEEGLYGSAGAAEEMSDIMTDNLYGSTKQLTSAWEEMKLQLYDVAKDGFRWVTDELTGLVQGFNNLTDTGLEFSSGFGDGVTAATSQALSGLQDTYRELQTLNGGLQYTSGEVTPEFAKEMAMTLEKWSEDTTTLLDKTYEEDLAILNQYFKDAGITDKNEKDKMTQKLKDHYSNLKTENQSSMDEINKIIQDALDTRGFVTEEEQLKIEQIISESNQRIIENAATSVEEETALLEALSDDKDKITKASGEKLYKEAKNQKNNILKEAEALRNGEIKHAYSLKKTGQISETEYNAMVQTAKDKYGKIETESEEKFNEITKNVEGAAKDLGLKFDKETGEMKKKWTDIVNEMTLKKANFQSVFKIVTHLTEKDERTHSKGLLGLIFGKSDTYAYEPVGYGGYSTRGIATPSMAGYERTESTTNNNGINVSVGNMSVRNEVDINRIAEQIYRIQKRNQRGRGVFGNV